MPNLDSQFLITADDLRNGCGINFNLSGISKSRYTNTVLYGWQSGEKYYSNTKYYTSPLAEVMDLTLTGNGCSGTWGLDLELSTEGSYTQTSTWSGIGDYNGTITMVESYIPDGSRPGDGALAKLSNRTINGSITKTDTILDEDGDPVTHSMVRTLIDQNGQLGWRVSYDGAEPIIGGAPDSATCTVVTVPPFEDDRDDYFNEVTPVTTICCESDYPSYDSQELSSCQSTGDMDYAYNFDINNYNYEANREIKFKLWHNPSPTCYFKAWTRKKIVNYQLLPTGGRVNYLYPKLRPRSDMWEYQGSFLTSVQYGPKWIVDSVTYQNLGEYIWDQRSSNCKPPFLYDSTETLPVITSNEYEIIPNPGTFVQFEIYKYSLHPNYTPEDPPVGSIEDNRAYFDPIPELIRNGSSS